MPRPDWTAQDRHNALSHLHASLDHLTRCTRLQFAQELLVQGLDLLTSEEVSVVMPLVRAELLTDDPGRGDLP